MIATDVTDRFYQCGRNAAQDLALGNIVFQSSNIQQINAVDEFDLVMSCNMLNFMTSRDIIKDVLTRLWRAAKVGRYICIYTPHFWTLREPFTSVPLLHFLPVRTQDHLARKWKIRSTMMDVRSPSVREICLVFATHGAKRIGVRPTLPKRLLKTHVGLWFRK